MNSVHLKIDNYNAREMKKELLLVELGILNSVKKIRGLKKTRRLEFSAKNAIRGGLRNINTEINKINEIMPIIEKSGILKKIVGGEGEIKTKKAKLKKTGKKERKDHIEKQLEEIKEKLAALE